MLPARNGLRSNAEQLGDFDRTETRRLAHERELRAGVDPALDERGGEFLLLAPDLFVVVQGLTAPRAPTSVRGDLDPHPRDVALPVAEGFLLTVWASHAGLL